MNNDATTSIIVSKPEGELSSSSVFALASGAGFAVASIYYAQPILPLIQHTLSLSVNEVGMVPTLTQFGYALGLCFLIPLGDRYDRRTLIAIKSILLAVVLLMCSMSTGIAMLLTSSLLIGITATLAQDIVPSAAILAPAAKQGKVVGNVMTGLLTGILLSRTFSGFVAEQFNWRLMYQLAAVSILISGVVLWRVLPKFAQHSALSYPALLKSMVQLFRRHPSLRSAAIAQGLLSVSFSAFWSTLALMLSSQFNLGSDIAGAYGLAGAAGAVAAPFAGSFSDRVGPSKVTLLGSSLVALSFVAMFALPLLPVAGQLVLIALAAVVFDFGMQSSMVAHQSLIYRLDLTARGRINAVFFTTVFIGMAMGSLLGTQAFAHAGWPAVLALATVSALAALCVRIRAIQHE